MNPFIPSSCPAQAWPIIVGKYRYQLEKMSREAYKKVDNVKAKDYFS